MYMKKIITSLAFVYVALFIPAGGVEAFEFVESDVTPLSGDAYLYELTYEFGYLNATASLPVLTGERAQTLPQITYDFVTPTLGTSAGIVLSDAPIVNGYYQTVPGKRSQFTLFVIYRHGVSRVAVPAVAVTSLVHRATTDNGTRVMTLTPGQLTAFQAQLEN